MKRVVWGLFHLSKTCLITFLLAFLRLFAKNLTLAYFSEFNKDGLGAQAQRMLTVYGLARFLQCNYLHSSISFIPSHPLDGHNTVKLRRQYLREVNDFFSYGNSSQKIKSLSFNREIFVNRLTLRVLIREVVTSFTSKKTLMYIDEPFTVADYCYPVRYMISTFPIPKTELMNPESKKSDRHLVIHYRVTNGVFSASGNDHVIRQQKLSDFQKVIESVIIESKSREIFITFLTDAPSVTMNIPIPSDELHFWQTMPGHEDGFFKIEGVPDEDFLELLPLNLRHRSKIIRGGSPLQALKIMIHSRYLIMSRSSLSYTGALLNPNGIIYFPSGFWHPKKINWRSY